MGFICKVELKKQLQALGVKVGGNYIRKKDIEVFANKHFSEYTREDILKCLKAAGLTQLKNGKPIEKVDTKTLSRYLNDAITEGDAPELDDL